MAFVHILIKAFQPSDAVKALRFICYSYIQNFLVRPTIHIPRGFLNLKVIYDYRFLVWYLLLITWSKSSSTHVNRLHFLSFLLLNLTQRYNKYYDTHLLSSQPSDDFVTVKCPNTSPGSNTFVPEFAPQHGPALPTWSTWLWIETAHSGGWPSLEWAQWKPVYQLDRCVPHKQAPIKIKTPLPVAPLQRCRSQTCRISPP